MNIFVLDRDQEKCVQYQNDRHTVKMVLETSQILCSVHHWAGTVGVPYRKTHMHHRCVVWARTSIQNYQWLLRLGFFQVKEYTHRYGKSHQCERVLNWCRDNAPKLPDSGLTEFVQCLPESMPDELKSSDAVTSYRNLYMTEKAHLASWKNRSVPDWFNRP